MIIWIASYPKSGNTWVRSFLSNYLSNKNDFNFEQLNKINTFPRLELFNDLKINYQDFKNISSNWLTMQEYINLRNETTYLKTHNAMATINNFKFTDKKNTSGFIYLVRDPRDVLLSYSSHLGLSIQDTFELMKNDLNFELIDDDINQKKAIIGSWSSHYKSWKSLKSVKGLFIKYEDMVNDTKNIFFKIISYLNTIDNLEIDEEKINKCIKNTSFKELQNLEKQSGFKEKGENQFFRSGEVGQGEKTLDNKVLNEIEKIFGKEMEELGYL